MKLRYILFPMENAAAWQVVEDAENCLTFKEIAGHELRLRGEVDVYCFDSNTERDEWIAVVHKHICEWAYGKEDVPEAVREADELLENMLLRMRGYVAVNRTDIKDMCVAWREKWMKPREPKLIRNFLYEV